MPRVRLGELLLSRGVVDRAGLAAAWEQQVLYGDRLGTNLLAVGAIDEAALATALGVQHGVHAGSGDVLHVDAAIVPLLPAALAAKRHVVPHHVVERTLFLLMRDPEDLRAIDDVRFATRLKVQPIVVCEARMWMLLAEHYGESVSLRPNPLLGTALRRPPSPVPAARSAGDGDDLVSEDEFHALYARVAASPGGAGAVVARAAPVAELPTWSDTVRGLQLPVAAATFTDALSADESLEPVPEHAPELVLAPPRMQAVTSPSMPVPVTAPIPTLELAAEWQRSLEVTNPLRARPGLLGPAEIELVEVVDFDPETVPPDAPLFTIPRTDTSTVAPDLTPLTFAEATATLATAKDRDEIARIVLRAAHARFARAALFTVFPHAFVGWQGLGEGYETITRVSVPRGAESVFSLVAESRAHYLGPLQRFTAHGAFVKATGKRIPRSLFVLPILVRGQTVALLIADNGHDAHVDGDVGELLILARHIAVSWEALLARWS